MVLLVYVVGVVVDIVPPTFSSMFTPMFTFESLDEPSSRSRVQKPVS